MPLAAITVTQAGGLDGADGLASALDALPRGRPVVLLIHGFKYRPGDPRRCPHRHILALRPDPGGRRRVSWPRHLGVGRDPAAPLCVAVGWPAGGSIWQAWRSADTTARTVADLIGAIAARRGAPVHGLAHSLGARVALRAAAAAPAGSVGRLLLLSAAAAQEDAAAALAVPGLEAVSVASRENDLFDAALELALGLRDRSLGAGLSAPHRRWADLDIGAPETGAALSRLGHPIRTRPARVCHWSPYLTPGLFGLYRRLLLAPGTLPLSDLRAALPARVAPRWSRLLPPRPAQGGVLLRP
ncbi:hypothetical protein DXV76_02895 [Rhodobacteraceae bacterium CCMM004]|nr:hypothetical protein DXV76_02895 [Rhodobacteraceae bacterium CCMM004]